MSGMELHACTAGNWHGAPPTELGGISSDTRSLHEGDAFIALRGPNFDGHAFAAEAVNRGAAALIGDAAGIGSWKGVDLPQLEVQDGLRALGDIASHWRSSGGYHRFIRQDHVTFHAGACITQQGQACCRHPQ